MKTPWEKLDKGATFAEMWDGFLTATIPPEASDAQKRDMQGAFYAGGLCLFNWFMMQMDDTCNPDDVTDNDLDRVDKMDAELREHFTSLRLRR